MTHPTQRWTVKLRSRNLHGAAATLPKATSVATASQPLVPVQTGKRRSISWVTPCGRPEVGDTLNGGSGMGRLLRQSGQRHVCTPTLLAPHASHLKCVSVCLCLCLCVRVCVSVRVVLMVAGRHLRTVSSCTLVDATCMCYCRHCYAVMQNKRYYVLFVCLLSSRMLHCSMVLLLLTRSMDHAVASRCRLG